MNRDVDKTSMILIQQSTARGFTILGVESGRGS